MSDLPDNNGDAYEYFDLVMGAIKATGVESDLLDLLSDEIPLLKTVTSLRDRYLAKKLQRMFEGVAKGEISAKQKAMLKLSADPHFRREFGAHLFHYVDSFDRVEKVDMLVNAFLGLAHEEITSSDYRRMARAIRHLMLEDLQWIVAEDDWPTDVAEELCVVGFAARRVQQDRDRLGPLKTGPMFGSLNAPRQEPARIRQQFSSTDLGRAFIECQRNGPIRLRLPAPIDAAEK